VPDHDRVRAHRLEVKAVSLRLSPFDDARPLAEKLITSARSRLAPPRTRSGCGSESSKNRLTTVRPRRVGSFLIGRSASDLQFGGRVEHQKARRRA
jgi:hypothetical protein